MHFEALVDHEVDAKQLKTLSLTRVKLMYTLNNLSSNHLNSGCGYIVDGKIEIVTDSKNDVNLNYGSALG